LARDERKPNNNRLPDEDKNKILLLTGEFETKKLSKNNFDVSDVRQIFYMYRSYGTYYFVTFFIQRN